jgi:small-conductance mechanosensitive channel
MIYEKCRDILLREFELIQNAVIIQENIRSAVTEREWMVFEDHLSAMNAIQSKMESLETEREKLFTVFEAIVHEKSFSENLDEKNRFNTLVNILPENQRNDLTSIYRSLKLEALKLRIANEALMTYLGEIKSTLNEFFTSAFPERFGKMYTKEGTHFSNNMNSMVLNRSF